MTPACTARVCVEPSGVTTDAPNFGIQRLPPCMDKSCHKLGGKLKSAPKINVSFPISRGKTHVVNQMGIDAAAKTNSVFEASCEQQNLPLHDPSDPLRQSWAGAENSSFVCTYRQGLRNQRVRNNASALVPLFARADCCTARAST